MAGEEDKKSQESKQTAPDETAAGNLEVEEEAPAGPPRPVTMGIFITSLVFLLVLSIGMGLVFYYSIVSDIKTESLRKSDKWIGAIYSLGEVTASLKNGSGEIEFKISIELNDDQVLDEVFSKHIQLVDAVVRIISSKEFNEVDDAIKQNALKRVMLNEMNSFLTSGRIVNIYFSEYRLSSSEKQFG